METRIFKTLSQWFPDAFVGIKKSDLQTEYGALHHFAKHVKKLIDDNDENKGEPFKIINLLYSKGTLFEKNAIENEFFTVIAFEETPKTLREHLDLMPEALRAIYLKTILEN